MSQIKIYFRSSSRKHLFGAEAMDVHEAEILYLGCRNVQNFAPAMENEGRVERLISITTHRRTQRKTKLKAAKDAEGARNAEGT